MMDREAVVTRLEGEHAYVVVGEVSDGCGRCHEAGGCQSGILGRIFGSRPREFRIANRIGAAPGDAVVLRAVDGATFRAAFLAYVLPLALLLAGAVAGTALASPNGEDVAAALGALAGLLCSMLLRLAIPNAMDPFVAQPVLLRRRSSLCIKKEPCQ